MLLTTRLATTHAWRSVRGALCNAPLRHNCASRSHSCAASSAHLDTSPGEVKAAVLSVPTPMAMEVLAEMLASHVQAGDSYCLFGEVGAGKSVFSRAFVRSTCGDPEMPVPSPTFLLQQTYGCVDANSATLTLHHFDLYRLKTSQELQRLCLEVCFAQALCLVEWAERLVELASLPPVHLAIDISIVRQGQQVHGARASGARGTDPTSQIADSTQDQSDPKTPLSGAWAAPAVHGQEQSSVMHTSTQIANPHDSPLQHMDESTDMGQEAGDDADEYEGSDFDEEDEFSDQRQRRVELRPVGQYWEEKVSRLCSYIEQCSGEDLEGLTLEQRL